MRVVKEKKMMEMIIKVGDLLGTACVHREADSRGLNKTVVMALAVLILARSRTCLFDNMMVAINHQGSKAIKVLLFALHID